MCPCVRNAEEGKRREVASFSNVEMRCEEIRCPPSSTTSWSHARWYFSFWNRKRDRKWVEKKLGIAEKGALAARQGQACCNCGTGWRCYFYRSLQIVLLYQYIISGNSTTVFVNELDTAIVIAVGYRRVLYGDHGPYIEFTKSQIHWESFPVIKPDKPLHAYYDERFTEDLHVMAYEQRKTVRDKPNPPPRPWSANHNQVETGYADYQPGYVYVSADCLDVLPQDSG